MRPEGYIREELTKMFENARDALCPNIVPPLPASSWKDRSDEDKAVIDRRVALKLGRDNLIDTAIRRARSNSKQFDTGQYRWLGPSPVYHEAQVRGIIHELYEAVLNPRHPRQIATRERLGIDANTIDVVEATIFGTHPLNEGLPVIEPVLLSTEFVPAPQRNTRISPPIIREPVESAIPQARKPSPLRRLINWLNE